MYLFFSSEYDSDLSFKTDTRKDNGILSNSESDTPITLKREKFTIY